MVSVRLPPILLSSLAAIDVRGIECLFFFWIEIEYATDIAEVFPTKHVTLLHSRSQLLPRFDEGMHDESECFLYFYFFRSPPTPLSFHICPRQRIPYEVQTLPKNIHIFQKDRMPKAPPTHTHTLACLLCPKHRTNPSILRSFIGPWFQLSSNHVFEFHLI